MAEVNIEELLKRIEALEQDKAKLENEFTELKNDYSELKNQVDIHSSFLSAIAEAQDWSKTMENVERVTEQITNCDNAVFYCFDSKEQKFFTTGENDYIEWHTQEEIAEVYAAKEQNTLDVQETTAYIPISSNGNTIGIVVAEKSDGFDAVQFEPFMPDGEIANTISLAINKEFNHQNAVTDELTKLKNRDGLNEYANKTLCGNINSNNSVFIVMCDIDKFKSVNDTYGHDAGDVILKNVAAVLQNGTRSGSDCAFRMGGEEMVLILNCDPDKAYDICERLRTEVENTTHTVMVDGKETDINVTVSMGLYQMQPTVEMTPENARAVFDAEFKKADELVYVAKETGRNKVVASPDIYNAYLTAKTASVIVESPESQKQLQPEILKCIKHDDIGAITEALDDAYMQKPDVLDAVNKIKSDIIDADKRTYSSADSFGTIPYNDISDKKYIAGITSEQLPLFKAALDDKGILYSGTKNEETGRYTVTVDGWDNLKSARNIYNDIKINQPFAEKESFMEITAEQNVNYSRYTDEQIQQAKNTSLLDFAKKQGFDCIKQGNEYAIKGQGGLRIKPDKNSFYIHSRQEGGVGAIAFAQKVMGMGFKEAMQVLTESEKGSVTNSSVKEDTLKVSDFLARCKYSVQWANQVNVRVSEIQKDMTIPPTSRGEVK